MQPYSNEYDTLMSVVRSMISHPILMISLWIEREPSLSYLLAIQISQGEHDTPRN